MFTCTLEAASKTPLCEQLYTALKREMERGGSGCPPSGSWRRT